MPKIIICSRCGKETQEELLYGKLTKNCKECREAHNNKNRHSLKTENQPKEGFYKQEQFLTLEDITEPQEEEHGEEPQDITETDTQDITEQEREQEEEQPNKTIKQQLLDITNNINDLIVINTLHTDLIRDILNTIKCKLDKTISNVNNTEEDTLTEYIKKQQLQNKIMVNKLDSVIKAIT